MKKKQIIKKIDKIIARIIFFGTIILVSIIITNLINNIRYDIINKDNAVDIVENTKEKENKNTTIIEDTKKKEEFIFNEISTTAEEYQILRDNCEQYIIENDIEVIELNNDININESTYTDKVISNSEEIDKNVVYETGPIYLQDTLIMRYINKDNNLVVIASQQSTNNTTYLTSDYAAYKILSQSETEITKETEYKTVNIKDLYLLNKLGINDTNILKYDMTNFNLRNSIEINEEAYISNLIDIILNDKTYENYFTQFGYDMLLVSLKELNIDINDISIVYIELGKSKMDLEQKDRVVLQIKNKDTIETLILKLNETNEIFDIDII